ncbi:MULTISPECIES: DUF937 domain-containing protein [Microbacterium]|uniref:DUF937 domain-containing protein n=1 Tax=Microbacterium TaxID=33882 RepID=UPI0011EA8D67|nr:MULTISPECIES: DUF937 domain-containing protein [Microbacterium]
MALDDILSQVPLDDLARKLGVSRDEAKVAVEQGGAVLLGGLAKNAQTTEGSAAIEKALGKHQGATRPSTVDDIDQTDGGKIVSHILGGKEKEVTKELTESKATPGIDFGTLLPILAPIVMGLIANATKSKTPKADSADENSGGIGDVIGGILGGGNRSSGGIGDVLGGILGGGTSGSGGGIDLGGVLGGLFGGKK